MPSRRPSTSSPYDREEVIITRAGHDPVVIVSLEDYESLRETAYLMRSPANARRQLDAMERREDGQGEPHDMITRTDVRLVWDENAWQDYLWWQAQDRRVLKRISLLLTDIQRDGNEGIGKPEALSRASPATGPAHHG